MRIQTAYIEITNRCNLNCQTCYNSSGLNRVTKELSPEQVEAIYLRFRAFGMKRMLISGGEPSLHSRFHDVLVLADKYPELSLGIVTNGTNPDPVLIDALNTRPNMTLQISLDGASEESNQKTRGVGNFAKVIDFVRQIHMHETPRLKMVISKYNLEDVEAFYRLALSIGFQPEYAFIYHSGNAQEGWADKSLTVKDKIHVLKLLDRLNKELGGNAFLPLCTSRCPFTGELNNLSISIQVDGTMQPCQTMHDPRYSIGNAFTTDDETMVGLLDRIAQTARQRMITDYGCAKCLLQDACGRGCMAGAQIHTGDPLGDDGECAYRKSVFLGYSLQNKK